MRASFLLALAATLLFGASPASADQHGKRWSYDGATGPWAWGRLDPAWRQCLRGQRQSPIDVRPTGAAVKPALELAYWKGATGIENTGHGVRLTFPPGNTLTIDGADYALAEVHFHTPAEHRLEGRRYDLEAHFVHRSEGKGYAVIAVLYQTGVEDPILADIIDAVPEHSGYTYHLPDRPRPVHLLPSSSWEYHRYYGSLTTPPCTEPVLWLIMKQPRVASEAQIGVLRDALQTPNNRPLQRRNSRLVVR